MAHTYASNFIHCIFSTKGRSHSANAARAAAISQITNERQLDLLPAPTYLSEVRCTLVCCVCNLDRRNWVYASVPARPRRLFFDRPRMRNAFERTVLQDPGRTGVFELSR